MTRSQAHKSPRRHPRSGKATSSVGRGKALELTGEPASSVYRDDLVELRYGDSLTAYESWPAPDTIISDGAYGVLGFEGDTSDHLDIPDWYEPHVQQWARWAKPSTTLWFWNSEIGWAAAHPVLERHGWRYVSCNVWSKGKGHIAGNVNTEKIRKFPVVTEVCVHYVREPQIGGVPLKRWLRDEWLRTGLPLHRANDACGVKSAASRKYLDQGHLWYLPPPDAFEKLQRYANDKGDPNGRPYFSADGAKPLTAKEWRALRSVFRCPHGVTNVWDRPAVRGAERLKTPTGKAVHLNQKPLDLMKLLIEASTERGDVVWEPFGGLFTASLAARSVRRRAYGAELDSTYYRMGVERFSNR